MARFLDDRSFERTRDAVLWAEEERARPGDPEPQSYVEPVFVKVTSGTADGNGYYPGVVSVRRGPTNDWEDLTVTVRVKGPNAETLTNNSRYGCRPAGLNSSNEDTFVTLGSGAGGSITVREDDEAGTTVETITGVTTLIVKQGTASTKDTGLRVDSPTAGQARVVLNPCGDAVADDGGAVLPGLNNQVLGYRCNKSFSHKITISYGDSPDTRPSLVIGDERGGTGVTVGLVDFVKTSGDDGHMRYRGFGAADQDAGAGIDMGASFLRFYGLDNSGSAGVPQVIISPNDTVNHIGGVGQSTSFSTGGSTYRFSAGWLVEVTTPLLAAPLVPQVWSAPPESPSAPGAPGDVAFGEKHLYVCTAPDTWGRVALEFDWHA